MFSIEHDFDCTTVTLVDEGEQPLLEDLTLHAFAECVTIEQLDSRTDQVQKITLSYSQVRDLAAALDLPEGVYRLVPDAAPKPHGSSPLQFNYRPWPIRYRQRSCCEKSPPGAGPV